MMTEMEYIVPSFVVLGAGAATIIIAILATTANSLLLFVIYKDPYKCLRRPSTGFIAALSITDLVTGLVTEPTYVAAVLEGYSNGNFKLGLRTVAAFCGIITYTSGVLFVMALALERVLACGFVPFYRNYVRFRTTIVISCFIWLYSVFFSVLQFLGVNDEAYHFVDISLHHVLPLLTIALAYAALSWLIRRRRRAIIPAQQNTTQGLQTTPNGITTQQALQIQRERQMAIVVMITGLLLFVSLVPYLVVIALTGNCSSCNQNVLYAAFMISVPILYINSIVNPFLYAWRLPQYKRSFKAVLPKCILI